jgi:PAS domain S-box-containing protein
MKPSLSDYERRLINRLHEKEHFIEQVANHSPDIIYVLDLSKNRITYSNRRAHEIAGAENIGLDEFHPDDLALRKQHLEACASLDKNEMKDLTARMRVKSGQWRWFWIRDMAFKFDLQGRVTHTIGVMRDIQDKKQWASTLIEQEKMLDAVLNVQSVSIVAYRAVRNARHEIVDFEFILLSRAFEDFHKRYDLLGKRVFEEFPIARQLEYDHWVEVVETGQEQTREASFPHPETGKLHHFSLKLEKFGDGFLIMWEDITSRKAAEKQREETMKLLNSIVNSKQLGIYVCRAVRDIQGRIEDYEYVLVSKSAEKFVKRSDLPGKRVFEEYPFLREADEERLRTVVEQGQMYAYERTFPVADGTERWFSVKLEKLGDGYIVITDDITESKDAKDKITGQARLIEDIAMTIPDVLIVIDLRRREPEYINKQAPEILNKLCHPGGGSGQPSVIDRQEADHFYELLAQLKSGETCVAHWTWETAGGPVWHRLRGRIIERDAAGAARRALVIAEDITKKKRAEKRADEAMALLRGVFDSSPVQITAARSVRDAGGAITDFEVVLCNRTGPSNGDKDRAGTRLSQASPEFFVPDKERLCWVVNTGLPESWEQAWKAEGAEKWLYISAVKLGDGFLVSALDISEKKRASLKSAESARQLEDVFRAAPIHISVTKSVRDAGGRITDFEYTLVNRPGHPGGASLAGKRSSEVYPRIKASGIFERLVSVVETGVPDEWQQFYDGEGYRGSYHIRAVKHGDGYVSTAIDLSALAPAAAEEAKPGQPGR